MDLRNNSAISHPDVACPPSFFPRREEASLLMAIVGGAVMAVTGFKQAATRHPTFSDDMDITGLELDVGVRFVRTNNRPNHILHRRSYLYPAEDGSMRRPFTWTLALHKETVQNAF